MLKTAILVSDYTRNLGMFPLDQIAKLGAPMSEDSIYTLIISK